MKYVYLLKAGENHYKVGIAISVNRRIKSIQTSNANRIYCVTAKLVKNAGEVEQDIHKKLKSLSAGGGKEWFVLEPEDVIRIAILINQQPEIDVYANTDLNEQLNEQNLRHKRIETKIDRVLNTLQTGKVKPQESPSPYQDSVSAVADDDTVYQDAIRVVKEEGRASTSLLQRKLRIGYGRAARLIEELEAAGVVGMADGSRARAVLVKSTDIEITAAVDRVLNSVPN